MPDINTAFTTGGDAIAPRLPDDIRPMIGREAEMLQRIIALTAERDMMADAARALQDRVVQDGRTYYCGGCEASAPLIAAAAMLIESQRRKAIMDGHALTAATCDRWLGEYRASLTPTTGGGGEGAE